MKVNWQKYSHILGIFFNQVAILVQRLFAYWGIPNDYLLKLSKYLILQLKGAKDQTKNIK